MQPNSPYAVCLKKGKPSLLNQNVGLSIFSIVTLFLHRCQICLNSVFLDGSRHVFFFRDKKKLLTKHSKSTNASMTGCVQECTPFTPTQAVKILICTIHPDRCSAKRKYAKPVTD
ncbi:hypothetical protein MXB_4458 [Myxobolus squamalis]|nr:hypothetical protein MXB_4458 [Myxobolus squamalis]